MLDKGRIIQARRCQEVMSRIGSKGDERGRALRAGAIRWSCCLVFREERDLV